MVKLSDRLLKVAEKIPRGCRIADIGSDHALLPTYLAERSLISSAIAGELNLGPLASAQKTVDEAGVGDIVSVREGDGLDVVEPGEVNVVSIAGMGGSLIVRILSQNIDKLAGVDRLVLQPNVGENAVRRWLFNEHWYLSDESIIEEDGKIYEVLTADKVADFGSRNRSLYFNYALECGLKLSTDWLFAMGPHLLKQPNTAFFRRWEGEIAKFERVRRGIAKSDTVESHRKAHEISRKIAEIQEVLDCLQMGAEMELNRKGASSLHPDNGSSSN